MCAVEHLSLHSTSIQRVQLAYVHAACIFHAQVLNEVVIDRGGSPFLSDLEVYCNDELVTKVQGDGMSCDGNSLSTSAIRWSIYAIETSQSIRKSIASSFGWIKLLPGLNCDSLEQNEIPHDLWGKCYGHSTLQWTPVSQLQHHSDNDITHFNWLCCKMPAVSLRQVCV